MLNSAKSSTMLDQDHDALLQLIDSGGQERAQQAYNKFGKLVGMFFSNGGNSTSNK